MSLRQTRLKSVGALALALTCGVAFFGAQPASAGTLLDFLRSNKHGQTKQAQQRIERGEFPSQPVFEEKAAEVKPLPKVSGPQYYTYKAEGLRLVASSKFADPLVTGAIAGETATVTPVSLDADSDHRRLLTEARVRATDEIAKALEAYYGSNKPLLWIDNNAVSDKAKAALAVLSDADAVGLDARDYSVLAPSDQYDSMDEAGHNRALMQFELELSAKVLAYVQDTVRGRVDPNKISGYHDFKRKTVNLPGVLKVAAASPDIAAYLGSRTPSGPQFALLKAELAKLRAEQNGDDRVVITLTGLLKPGGSSDQMANIVAAIGKHGSDALKVDHALTLSAYQQTPDYTPELVALVEAFQKERGLKPDGVIGQATVRAMVGDSDADKINKLVVALEQARWLPADLGSRYVFINQPAYMVYYHNNNREELSMRTVVGSRSNQTYFFQDEIETVEFNPFWGVPQSIIINEMLPKLRSDPSYLDRLGYEVAVNGQAVSSTSVNWNGSTNAISVRQPPSGDNALGELKILFPNSHAIYMHDTPSKSFFKRDVRALSHGCVRLDDPRAMAAAVLGTTVEDVGKQIAAGKNKAVQVPEKFPVYVAYFTAWPNKDNVVEYFDDVYGRDAYVNKAFETTSKARAAQG
ncbi:MAG: peptidoglycan-binding protein [Rhizobium sp. 63-7]|nr:MAG: peptidoglycan-binding protein [Rhizobium sp. 63-7]